MQQPAELSAEALAHIAQRLRGMKLGTLSTMAAGLDTISADDLEAAQDEDNPKAAVAALILRAAQQGDPAAAFGHNAEPPTPMAALASSAEAMLSGAHQPSGHAAD